MRQALITLALFACAPAPTVEDTGQAQEAWRRMPGEHEPHALTVVAWPSREDLWGPLLGDVQAEHAAVVAAIAEFEPVLLVAAPGEGAEAAERCPMAEVVEIPIDDSWVRDTGPIFVEDGEGLLGLDFEFNGWGGKFPPWDSDDALPGHVCEHLDLPCQEVDMVLEGGAFIVDGEGTLVTTEECVLNENRNPDMTRAEVEGVFRRSLGVQEVVWLPYGVAGDIITDGHVDGVAAFVEPGVIMVQALPEDRPEFDPNRERLEANRAVLEAAVDASGRSFTLVDLPYMPDIQVAGNWTTHGYINFYLVNGGVIVPTAGVRQDEPALEAIQAAFPDREVVGVETPTLSYGGGGIHCITQQVPAF